MTLMLNMLIIISSMFLFTNHPLSMGLMLMMQTLLISMMMGSMSMKFWYSFIIFIIMVGGMLVLFLYMTSISSNKKFKLSWIMALTFFALMIITIFINNNIPQTLNIPFNLTVSKFYNHYSSSLMIMLMMYFLITLIAVVKITKTNFGPLRQK